MNKIRILFVSRRCQ